MAKTNFIDGDKVLGIPGTRVFAAFLNKIFSHRHDGIDADGSAPIDYAVDSGAVDAYVASFTPVFTAHITGLPLRVKILNTNTVNNPTLKIDALAVKTITRESGQPLNAGDLVAGGIYTFTYNGAGFTVTNPNYPIAHTHADAKNGGQITASGVTALLGAWDGTKAVDTVYQAPTDLTVHAWTTPHTGASDDLIGYTDSSNPPVTIAARDSSPQSGANVHGASITFTVKKNDYWKVPSTTGTVTIRIIPSGS